MRLKSLLFGSAAALMAVTGAQAAEPLEPIAEPIDYVRICDAFGTGFFFIPGTDTCIKIGGYVRSDFVYDHDWEDIVVFQENRFTDLDPGNPAVGRLVTIASPREDRNYNEFGTRARARLNIDTRVQTDIGMIRTYYDLWITFGPLNGRRLDADVGTSLLLRQAFIQIANDWGTLTFGRADSFFEFWESDAFATRGIGEDSPLSPVNLAAATFNLGGGVSASIALEDSATDGDRRLGDTAPTFFPVDLNEDGIPDTLGLVPPAGGPFAFPAGLSQPFPTGAAPAGGSGIHGGNRAPDVVANIRVDQAWGSAQVMAALHPIRARAFTGPAFIPALGLSPDQEPDTEIGWAVGAGAGIDIPGTGVTFNIQGVYADGAPGFATDRGQVGALSDGFVVGRFNPLTAAVAPGALIGTTIETTEAWSVKAGIGGDLAPDWVFNLQGNFARVDHPENLGAPLAGPFGFPGSGAPGATGFFAPGPAAVQETVFTSGGAAGGLVPGPTFSGDFDAWGVSGWVGWAPVRGFITALELAYEQVEFDAGPDTHRWGGVWRVQKSF